MLYSIQALRGFGAVAVVIFHALTLYPELNFRAGAAGVDIFFVISGIVMALSIKENAKPGIFLLRRVIRVVPLYWVMTGLAILNVYIFYPGASVGSDAVVRSMLFLKPANGSMPLLYPGWSLNYEMLFYVVLALFISFRRYCLPFVALVFIFLGSLSEIGYFHEFYFVKYYLLEFSLGILIGSLFKRNIKIERGVGILFLIFSFALFALHNYFKSEGFIAWGVPSILLVLGCYSFENKAIFRNKIVQMMGDASYSIYLVHPFVIWAFERNYSGSIVVLFFGIFLSIFFGVICFRWIEQPMLNCMLGFVRVKTKIQVT